VIQEIRKAKEEAIKEERERAEKAMEELR